MEFKKAVITKQGRELMAKLLAGGTTTQFTKIVVSSTVYSDAQLENLTALTNIKMTAPAQAYGNNTATVAVTAAVENTGLSVGFDVNTVGLYAIDPVKGEILYSISSANVKGYLPADTGVSKSGFNFKIYVEIGNASQVNLEVDPAAFVTQGDLDHFKVDYFNKTESDKWITDVMLGKSLIKNHKSDLSNKVVTSTSENPHIAKIANRNTLGTPTDYQEFSEQSPYNQITQLDNKFATADPGLSIEGYMKPILICWNLLEDIERKYPGIFNTMGATDTAEKVAAAKKILTTLSVYAWGYGTSPTGYRMTQQLWSGTSWIWSVSHGLTETNRIGYTLTKETSRDLTGIINSDGFIYAVIFANPTDKITSSKLFLDYVQINYTVDLKMSDFLVSKSEYQQEIGAIKTWIQNQGGTI